MVYKNISLIGFGKRVNELWLNYFLMPIVDSVYRNIVVLIIIFCDWFYSAYIMLLQGLKNVSNCLTINKMTMEDDLKNETI